MRKILILIFVLLILFPAGTRAQGSDCIHSGAICFSGNGDSMTFQLPVNAPPAQVGPGYGCLFSQPNPSWFIFMATSPGDIQLKITSNNDVDFACWGPFPHPQEDCTGALICNGFPQSHVSPGPSTDYPVGKMVDCSYVISIDNYCFIPNAEVGDIYILLVTNYSNTAGTLSIEKYDYTAGSAGQIQCFYPSDTNDSTLIRICQSDTLTLNPQVFDSANYFWYGPNGLYSNDSALLIENIQTNSSGAYTSIVVVDTVVAYNKIYVEVEPMPQSLFSANPLGNGVAEFNITHTADSNIFDFGDGDSNVNMAFPQFYYHLYDSAGTYYPTLIGFNDCGSDTLTVQIVISFLSVPLNPRNTITLAPNPTTGICRIDGLQGEEISLIQIRSADGRLLLSEKPDPSRTTIDLSSFSPGIYFLTLQTKTEMYRARILRISGQ